MTVPVLQRPIDRTVLQRRRSLELANEIRFLRAAMKKDLRAGRVDVVDLVEAPPSWLLSMKVCRLLAAVPSFGVVKTRRLMNLARISDAKTVGGLSSRQRPELAALLRERAAR